MIRLLVADDQDLVRSALATTLGLEDDIEVVGQAGDCAAAVATTAQAQPDVVLLDVQMPSGGLKCEDGIDAIAELLRGAPQAKVLVVTTFGRPGYLRRALEAGASGFMVKDAPVERLLDGIRRVHAGLRMVDPELAAASLSLGNSPLTEREAQVLGASVGGSSTAQVAAKLFLSEGTVRNYLSAAIGKLGARNRAEAIRTAEDNGWL